MAGLHRKATLSPLAVLACATLWVTPAAAQPALVTSSTSEPSASDQDANTPTPTASMTTTEATGSDSADSDSADSDSAEPESSTKPDTLKHVDLGAKFTSLGAQPGDELLVGDWDKDGKAGYGVRRGTTILLAESGDAQLGDYAKYTINAPGGRAVVGRWGTQRDTVAISNGNTVSLRRWFTDGNPDRKFVYGNPGDRLLSGDWLGNGYGGPLVRRGDTYFVRTTSTTGIASFTTKFGTDEGVAFTGDFDGDGKDGIAVVAGDVVTLRNDLKDTESDTQLKLPVSDPKILAADFDGDGRTDLGYVTAEYAKNIQAVPEQDPKADEDTESDQPNDSDSAGSDSPTDNATASPSPTASATKDAAEGSGFEQVIGKDLPSGVYRIISKQDDCSLSVLYADGETQSGRVQGGENAQVYLSLSDGDALTTTGCKVAEAKANPATMKSAPGDGEWLVGVDVPAGKYLVAGKETCFATIMSGTDRKASIVKSLDGKTESLTVKKGQMISTEGCTWSKLP